MVDVGGGGALPPNDPDGRDKGFFSEGTDVTKPESKKAQQVESAGSSAWYVFWNEWSQQKKPKPFDPLKAYWANNPPKPTLTLPSIFSQTPARRADGRWELGMPGAYWTDWELGQLPTGEHGITGNAATHRLRNAPGEDIPAQYHRLSTRGNSYGTDLHTGWDDELSPLVYDHLWAPRNPVWSRTEDDDNDTEPFDSEDED